MADENVPPKDLEVRLTELENAVKALTDAIQPTTSAQIPAICYHCINCIQCFTCVHCIGCVHCITCRPICAECNGCLAT